MSAEHPLKEGPFSGVVLDRSVRKVLREQGVSGSWNGSNEQPSGSVSSLATGAGNLCHCIADAVNAIYAAYAMPCAISLSIIMPYPAAEETLRELIRSAGAQCAVLPVAIETVTGRADPAVTRPVFTVNAVGRSVPEDPAMTPGMPQDQVMRFREIHSPEKREGDSFIDRYGQVMLMAGCAGESGARDLVQDNRKSLMRRFSETFLRGTQGSDLYIRDIGRIGACTGAQIYPLGEGGVLRGLWVFLEQLHAGFAGEMRSIPIRQETVEVCEALGKNPYTLYSGGSALLVTCRPEELLSRFWEARIPASVIGRLTEDRARVMTNGGETRYLERY